MAKIDVYLRSIERFGAGGAVLTSGQSVMLRFPTGDRHATQVTTHDQLVGLVREVAPPAALDLIDKNRPAKFDVESNGTRYSLSVSPKQGTWSVAIEPASAAAAVPAPAAAPVAAAPAPQPRQPRPGTAPTAGEAPDLTIERGQYDGGTGTPPPTTSGSIMLDQLTASARASRATDVFLATGAVPTIRVGGAIQELPDLAELDVETISRELGIVAPAEARGAWSERGVATFTYGDAGGRVRVTLVRDHRGPGASLRLLVGEAPPLERLNLPRDIEAWLEMRGLVLVAGGSGSGKTTTLAAMVASLGARQLRVVSIEDPIEILHSNTWISQRAVGHHVPGIAEGVAAAMREGADAIVVGTVTSAEAAGAVIDAVAAGHLVLATVSTTGAGRAGDHLIGLLPQERKDLARAVLDRGLLGAIAPVIKGTGRTFEVAAGRGG